MASARLTYSFLIAVVAGAPAVAHADEKTDACIAQLKPGRACVLVFTKDGPAPVPDAGATECYGLIESSKDKTKAEAKAEATVAFDNKTPAGFKWDKTVILGRTGERCAGFVYRALKKPDQAPPPPVVVPPPPPVVALAPAVEAQLQAADLAGLLDTYQSASTKYAIVGEAKSGDAVAELVQVLGQVVLERGSQAAMALGQQRLLEALQCDVEASERDKNLPEFPHTCALVRSMSIEDLAAAGKLLKQSLIADLHAFLGKRAELSALDSKIKELIELAIERVVLSSLTRRGQLDARAVEAILSELLVAAKANIPAAPLTAPSTAPERALLSLAIAGAALAACELSQAETALLKNCDIEQHVRTLASRLTGAEGDITKTRQLAQTLAGHLLVARAPAGEGDQVRERAHSVVEVVFAVGCESVGGCQAPEQIVIAPCEKDDTEDQCAARNKLKAGEYLALLRPFAHAAVDLDGAAIVRAGIAFVASSAQTSSQRSVRMLVRLLQVSEAYASARDVEATEGEAGSTKLEQRKALVEGLADDFADRTGRAGDTIVSLGGSLRLLAGYRAVQEGEKDAMMGPLGLTLGLSLAHLAQEEGCAGFFMELAVVDLGQYVAFEDGTELKKPEVDAILSPWLTLGAAWGKQNPFFVAVSAGYSPAQRANESKKVAGSFNVGLTAGINVPLLDLN